MPSILVSQLRGLGVLRGVVPWLLGGSEDPWLYRYLCCFFIRLADSDVLVVNLISGTGNDRFGSLADPFTNIS